MIGEATGSENRLRAIADILGISVDQMFCGDEPHPQLAENACLHLWHRLKTDAGRDMALDALRKVLDDEGASSRTASIAT